MQAAIDAAYIFPNQTALGISSKGGVPTIEEFIDYSIKQLKNDKE